MSVQPRNALSPMLFGYYENRHISVPNRLRCAQPITGSFLSWGLIKLAIAGVADVTTRLYNRRTHETITEQSQIELSSSLRIQALIRGCIGLIPVVGLALIPIDLVATAIDAIRHKQHARAHAQT